MRKSSFRYKAIYLFPAKLTLCEKRSNVILSLINFNNHTTIKGKISILHISSWASKCTIFEIKYCYCNLWASLEVTVVKQTTQGVVGISNQKITHLRASEQKGTKLIFRIPFFWMLTINLKYFSHFERKTIVFYNDHKETYSHLFGSKTVFFRIGILKERCFGKSTCPVKKSSHQQQ